MANYNLFDAASLAMVPTGVKDGKLYSVKPDNGDGDFTFSRGTNLTATRVNADGLIEKGRENLLTQSNNFSTTWYSGGLSETSGQSGYDGSSDAWLIEALATGTRFLEQNISSGVNTFSVYAKAGTTDWIMLNDGGGSSAYFDIANGVLGSNSGADYIDHSIESISSGWYRCSLTSVNIGQARIYLAVADGNLSNSVGNNIYIQDAQLEQGLVATDYIETTTAAVQAGITEDLPRIDYTDGCGSLLLEPSRTNNIPHSEYVSAMSLSSVSATANATTSPEGVDNGYEVEPTGSGFKTIGNFVSVTAGSKYTISFFYKNNDHKNIGFYDNNTSGSEITINVQDNTFTLGASCDDGDVEDYGNGWYRARCTFSASSSTLANYLIFRNDSNSGSYTATGSSIYVYGFQLEAGSYPTSYIPTYGTATSRAQDFCVTASPSTSSFGQTEGTIFTEITINAITSGSYSRVLNLKNSGGSNQIYIQQNDSRIQATAFNGSNQFVGSTSFGFLSVGSSYKIALGYKDSDYALYINGTQIATGSASGLGTLAVNRVDFTTGAGNIPLGNQIKQSLVFNTRLTNNELAALTRPYDTYQEWVDGEGLTWESKSCTVQNLVELQNL